MTDGQSCSSSIFKIQHEHIFVYFAEVKILENIFLFDFLKRFRMICNSFSKFSPQKSQYTLIALKRRALGDVILHISRQPGRGLSRNHHRRRRRSRFSSTISRRIIWFQAQNQLFFKPYIPANTAPINQ